MAVGGEAAMAEAAAGDTAGDTPQPAAPPRVWQRGVAVPLLFLPWHSLDVLDALFLCR